MGQRLNLEIWNNGKVLANAYYHWSAFTDEAAKTVKQALNYIKSNSIENDNTLLYAIRILEATGAGLTEREIEYAKKFDCFKNQNFTPCNGRNAGLIGISPDEINQTRFWQEYAAYIFIDEERFSFRVFWTQRKWEYEKEQKEEYDNDIKADDLTRTDWPVDDIKFNDWEDFFTFLKQQDGTPWISNIDPCEVILPIQ